ncbi:hypothetical protein H0H93_005040 [Arthromyces matolae]|nr:hypothetical protein H0H93_005040 [Arthromyces matolae]
MPSGNFPGGPNDLANAVVQQHTWVAVTSTSITRLLRPTYDDRTVNPGASARLEASYANPNSSYNGSEAVSVYAAEARNENAFRVLIRPTVELLLDEAQATFSMQAVRQMASLSSSQLNNLMTNSPQTLTTPIAWTLYNVRPFFEPVASAVTFVGLIYVLILSFFVVMIAYGAREASGLNRVLTLRSLIFTRYASSFAAYFIVSVGLHPCKLPLFLSSIIQLFYSLVSLAFQINFSIKFGRGGFVVFWMLNWMGMLSVGLALESLITIVTPKFIPFFMILWIIVNVSVCLQPIEVLPLIFRYGYAMPFYNISHAVRCIIFATKNQVGQNFGVLFAWIGISLLSLPLIQWYVRRDDVRMYESQKQGQAQAGKTLTRSSAGFPSGSPDSNEKGSIMLKENAGKTAPPQAQPFNANGSREKDGRSSPQTYSGSETAQESVENDSAVQRV